MKYWTGNLIFEWRGVCCALLSPSGMWVSTLKVLWRFWGEVLQRRTLVIACFKDMHEMSCTERRVPMFIRATEQGPLAPLVPCVGPSMEVPEAPALLIIWCVPRRRLPAVLPRCLAGTVRRVGEVLLTTCLPLQINTWPVKNCFFSELPASFSWQQWTG